jgi:hypothetical protein
VGTTYRAALEHPTDIGAWLRLAFVDLRSASVPDLYRAVRRDITPSAERLSVASSIDWAELRRTVDPPFRFGRNNEIAKFGVKTYQIDDYGDPVDGTVTYQIVEASLDSRAGAWNVLSSRTVQQNVPRDVDLILGAGLAVRLLVYGIAALFGLWFGLWIGLAVLKRTLGLVRSTGRTAKHEVVIRIEAGTGTGAANTKDKSDG